MAAWAVMLIWAALLFQMHSKPDAAFTALRAEAITSIRLHILQHQQKTALLDFCFLATLETFPAFVQLVCI